MATHPSKKRRLSPPDNGASDVKVQKAFFKNAASWNLEQDYESRPRKNKKKQKENNRLPVKTADGRLQQAPAAFNDTASVESDGDWLDGDGDEDGGDAAGSEDEEEKVEAQPTLSEREKIMKAKEELAKIGLQLSEDPEEHPGAFKNLARIGQSKLPAIQKLCMVTQLAIYKDVIPGYRIRPSSEDPAGQKLSKEVKRVRTYEHALVTGYQVYLKELAKYAKSRGSEHSNSLSKVALTCACTLVNTVPHFNFRTDLLKILVGKLSFRKVDDSFNKCLRSLETLFKEDEEGRPSMEAVSLLSKMMKAKNYQVHETVLNLFLYLRLLSEYSGKGSNDSVDRPDGANNKLSKKKWDFRTKRERKAMKEDKALAKEMAQADALVSHEERDRMQSETLKLVFATYFRALKQRQSHLMGAVLEGLAKYAHLINQDFFGDLLEALKDLIRHSEEDEAQDEESEAEDDEPTVRNTNREALLCTVTAFALLAGQDAHNARSDLHLDLSYFTTHLFQSLLPLSTNADLELGARSMHLPDPDSPQSAIKKANKINVQTMTVLLVRCLTAVLLPPWNIRSVPPLRLAAFTKQLMTVALQMPEKSCQAMLALLNDVNHTHGKKIASLWNTEERKDDGTFNPVSESVEGSNPFASTIWEGELLRRHYSPKVREGQKLLEKSLRAL